MTERNEDNHRRVVVSQSLENVICTMGSKSRAPNTIHIPILNSLILETLALHEDQKKKIERTEGLLRIEAVFVYADEDEIVTIDDLKKAAENLSVNPIYKEQDEITTEKIDALVSDIDEVLEGGEE